MPRPSQSVESIMFSSCSSICAYVCAYLCGWAEAFPTGFSSTPLVTLWYCVRVYICCVCGHCQKHLVTAFPFSHMLKPKLWPFTDVFVSLTDTFVLAVVVWMMWFNIFLIAVVMFIAANCVNVSTCNSGTDMTGLSVGDWHRWQWWWQRCCFFAVGHLQASGSLIGCVMCFWSGFQSPLLSPVTAFLFLFVGWLGSRVVNMLDSGAEGPGFKSQPWPSRVTVLYVT